MKIVESKEVYKCKIFRITEEKAVDKKTGFEIARSVVRHGGSAVMMAMDDKNRILLVRQYRLPADDLLWELPAGTVDPGEKPLQTAKRELTEETGYTAKTWTKLATFYTSPGYVDEQMSVFLATDLKRGEAKPMEDERIEMRWFKKKDVGDMIREGKIRDAKTLVGFFLGTRKK